MDKYLFRDKLLLNLNQFKPVQYFFIADMTINGYREIDHPIYGNVCDFDMLAVLSADINNNMSFTIGEFCSNPDEINVTVYAKGMHGFRYQLSMDPKVVISSNPYIANSIRNCPQSQTILDIMDAIYDSYLKA